MGGGGRGEGRQQAALNTDPVRYRQRRDPGGPKSKTIMCDPYHLYWGHRVVVLPASCSKKKKYYLGANLRLAYEPVTVARAELILAVCVCFTGELARYALAVRFSCRLSEAPSSPVVIIPAQLHPFRTTIHGLAIVKPLPATLVGMFSTV